MLSVYIYNCLLSIHLANVGSEFKIRLQITTTSRIATGKYKDMDELPPPPYFLPMGSEAILIKVTYYQHKCVARERFIKPDRDEPEKNKLSPSVSRCPLAGTATARYLHS